MAMSLRRGPRRGPAVNYVESDGSSEDELTLSDISGASSDESSLCLDSSLLAGTRDNGAEPRHKRLFLDDSPSSSEEDDDGFASAQEGAAPLTADPPPAPAADGAADHVRHSCTDSSDEDGEDHSPLMPGQARQDRLVSSRLSREDLLELKALVRLVECAHLSDQQDLSNEAELQTALTIGSRLLSKLADRSPPRASLSPPAQPIVRKPASPPTALRDRTNGFMASSIVVHKASSHATPPRQPPVDALLESLRSLHPPKGPCEPSAAAAGSQTLESETKVEADLCFPAEASPSDKAAALPAKLRCPFGVSPRRQRKPSQAADQRADDETISGEVMETVAGISRCVEEDDAADGEVPNQLDQLSISGTVGELTCAATKVQALWR